MPFDAGVDGMTEGVTAGVSTFPCLPRRRKAHMRAIALRQPLRFLRLLFSRGSARARSGNGAYNAPFPSSKAVKATPWLWRVQCAVSKLESGQSHTVALPRKRFLALFPQIFCFA